MKRLVVAIVGASLGSAAITSIGLFILNASSVDGADGDMLTAYEAYFLLSTVVVALVSSTIGLAWHTYASSRGWTNVHAYWLPALLVGVAPPQILVLNALQQPETWNTIAISIWMILSVYGAALGGLTGLFAWMIRRPDRDVANLTTSAS